MNKNASFAVGMLVAMMCSAASPEAVAQTRTPAHSGRRRLARRRHRPPRRRRRRRLNRRPRAEDSAAVKGSEVVARVGDSDVTAEEVRAAIAFLEPRQQAAVARDPALLSQTVRAILANRLVLKEALAKKWDQQPPVVAQLARARENLIVESYLQSVTAPPESYPNDAEIKSCLRRQCQRLSGAAPIQAGADRRRQSRRTPTRPRRIPRARSSMTC